MFRNPVRFKGIEIEVWLSGLVLQDMVRLVGLAAAYTHVVVVVGIRTRLMWGSLLKAR